MKNVALSSITDCSFEPALRQWHGGNATVAISIGGKGSVVMSQYQWRTLTMSQRQ